MELTQVTRRFACAIRDDALEVVDADGAGPPWLAAAPGDDLLAALVSVGRADAPTKLDAWLRELRDGGAARVGIGVVAPGGVRGTLTLTGVETDGSGACVVAARFGGPDGAEARPGSAELPDLRSALERLDEVCYELRRNPEGRWAATYVSPGWERLQGRAIPEDPVERSDTWLASIHPEDVRRATATALDGASRREAVSHEYRIVRGDGEVRWVRDRITGFAGSDGDFRVMGVTMDITGEKHRQLRLVELLRTVSELVDDPGAVVPGGILARLRALLAGEAALDPPAAAAAPMTFAVRVDGNGHPAVIDVDGRLLPSGGEGPGDLLRIVHPDDRDRVLSEFREIVSGAGEGTQLFRLARGDGTTWVRTAFSVTSRDPLEAAGSAIDVTDALTRVAAPPVVHEAHLGGDGEWRNDYLSPAAEDLFGVAIPGDARRRAAFQIEGIHGDDVRDVLGMVRDVVTSGGTRLGEYRIVRPDGTVRRVRTTFTRTSIDPVRLTGVTTDISGMGPDPVSPADAAAAHRLRFAEGQEDVLVEFDVVGGDVRPRYASPSANLLLGTPGLELGAARAATWMAGVSPGDRYHLVADVRAAHAGDAAIRGAHRVRNADGMFRWVRTVLRGSGGAGPVTCVATDITDLADAMALKGIPDGDQFARIVDAVPDGLWEIVVHDAATRDSEFTFVSRRMWEILGMEPADTSRMGDVLERRVHPEDRELSREQYGRMLRRGETSMSEHRIIRPDGAVRWVRWTGLGRFHEGGALRLVGTMRDVSDEPARRPAKPARVPRIPALTARQQEVLDHLVSGASTEEIARSMGIRPVTVSNHVAALLRRLGVRSRLEAVAMVLRQGTAGD